MFEEAIFLFFYCKSYFYPNNQILMLFVNSNVFICICEKMKYKVSQFDKKKKHERDKYEKMLSIKPHKKIDMGWLIDARQSDNKDQYISIILT